MAKKPKSTRYGLKAWQAKSRLAHNGITIAISACYQDARFRFGMLCHLLTSGLVSMSRATMGQGGTGLEKKSMLFWPESRKGVGGVLD